MRIVGRRCRGNYGAIHQASTKTTLPHLSLSLMLLTTTVFLLAGLVKGVVGLGLPTLAMALLALAMPPAQAAALLILPSLVTNVWQMRPWPTLAPMTRRLRPMQAGVVVGTLGGAWLLGAPAGAWAMQALGAALVVYGLWGLSGARVSQVPAGAERVLGPLVGAVTGLVTAHGGVRDSGRALSAGARSVARRAGADDGAVVHRFHRGAGGWADAERPVFGGRAERLGADAVAGCASCARWRCWARGWCCGRCESDHLMGPLFQARHQKTHEILPATVIPAKARIQTAIVISTGDFLWRRPWIPAFAGMTGKQRCSPAIQG